MIKLASQIKNQYHIPWMPCTCHIIDLLIRVFMKNEIFSDIFDFHRLWVHLTQLVIFLEQSNEPFKKLPRDCNTRWTSFSRIVRVLIALFPFIDAFCINNQIQRPNTLVLIILQTIEKLFQKYERALLELECDQFGVISKVIPHITSLINDVNNLPNAFFHCKTAFMEKIQEKWVKFQTI